MQKHIRYKDSERQATNAYLFYWKTTPQIIPQKN